MHFFGLTLITLLFYTFLRVLFLLWNWSLFQKFLPSEWALTFFYGLRFDLSAIAILAAPAFLVSLLCLIVRKRKDSWVAITFFIFQFPFLVINLFDTEYVQFTGRRFTLALLGATAEVEGKFWAIMIATWKLFLIACVSLLLYAIACWAWTRWISSAEIKTSGRRKIITAIVTFFVLITMARGGLQSKPIGFAHAQVFTSPLLNHLTMNSSFSFLQTLKRKSLPREHYMSEEKMLGLMNGRTPGESLLIERPAGAQNVVILILESFSLEHMGKIHGDQGYTPFLDELAEKSLFFPNGFANARRSIEGIAAVLGGIPSLMENPFISSPYATNTFYGLGTLLQGAGYSTAFYHGGKNGTMYFDQFARSAGIQKYFGENEYPHKEDSDGTWGIWDEPFLSYMSEDLNSIKEPFMASVFTLSSHNPFRVPTTFQGKFPKGTSEIHEVIGYSDESLRRFFAKASQQPWYSHTLFILTADHTFKPARPSYQNDLGNYRVPILFFHPAIKKWPTVNLKEPVQQIDILPSVLDFLKISPPAENLMGRSVFRAGPRYVVMSTDGFYWLVTKDHLLTVDPQTNAVLSPLVDHRDLKQRQQDMAPEENPTLKSELLLQLQATRQYFSEGLWDNRLYFPPSQSPH